MIWGELLEWSQCYLSESLQRNDNDGNASDFKTVDAGIPQRSPWAAYSIHGYPLYVLDGL